MNQKSAREPSQRQLRVGELVRHALADIFQRGDVHDPELSRAVITVSEVRMTPDLKTATVFLMPLGGQNVDSALAALNRNRKEIRHLVSRRVNNLRYAPDIRFAADTTFDEGARIGALLNSPEVRRDLDGVPSHDGDEARDRDED